MDTKQIRKLNLATLVTREGTQEALAEKVGTDAAYLSQILGEKGKARVGDRLALKIEKAYGMVKGAMDRPFFTENEMERTVAETLAADGWQVEKLLPRTADIPSYLRIAGELWVPDLLISKNGKKIYVEVKPPHLVHRDSPWLELVTAGKLALISSADPSEIRDQLWQQLAALSGKGEPSLLANQPDAIEIPKIDIATLVEPAPFVPEHEEVTERMFLGRAWLPCHVATTSIANLALASAHDDSMETTFAEGDILLIDTGMHEIKKNGIHLVVLNAELYVRRLQRHPDGAVLMISDNRKYEPYLIENGEREKLRILGRVVWAWTGKKL
ncbi:MAG: LexA family transcriptional regulator [Betaproteobacteria bacterium]|nr:LexA family transcriptional regulator [Betaproteobacteria bacterium]